MKGPLLCSPELLIRMTLGTLQGVWSCPVRKSNSMQKTNACGLRSAAPVKGPLLCSPELLIRMTLGTLQGVWSCPPTPPPPPAAAAPRGPGFPASWHHAAPAPTPLSCEGPKARWRPPWGGCTGGAPAAALVRAPHCPWGPRLGRGFSEPSSPPRPASTLPCSDPRRYNCTPGLLFGLLDLLHFFHKIEKKRNQQPPLGANLQSQ